MARKGDLSTDFDVLATRNPHMNKRKVRLEDLKHKIDKLFDEKEAYLFTWNQQLTDTRQERERLLAEQVAEARVLWTKQRAANER